MGWNLRNGDRYAGKLDRIHFSPVEMHDVEYFIDFFLYFHAFDVNDVNRARVAASMEQYPIDAPWRSKELTIFVELTLP
jgi:hypothetical protein